MMTDGLVPSRPPASQQRPGTVDGWSQHATGSRGGLPGLIVLKSRVPGLPGASLVLPTTKLVVGRGLIFDTGQALDDSRVSARHVAVERVDEETAMMADLGSRNGTLINGQTVVQAQLKASDVLQVGSTFLQLVPDVVAWSSEAKDAVSGELLGTSPALRRARDLLRHLAPLDVSVLVRGPAGAGKEHVARALHQASGRSGALVSINCAVLAAETAASELFGHVAGAFTGAVGTRQGAFRQACGGTLFLDEIADLSPALQPSLLRALEQRCIRPLGSDREVRVDARVISATNQDLERLVHEGKFRGDLYSRIDATSVVLPPLDERPVDIVVLAEHFLGRRRCLHPRALQDLLRHSWRYGVRDLRAVMTLPVCRPAFAIATSALRWLPFGGSISTATARAA